MSSSTCRSPQRIRLGGKDDSHGSTGSPCQNNFHVPLCYEKFWSTIVLVT